MIELYPQLGQTFDEQLKSALHDIGFTGWVHLRKEQRDGKVRLTWTYPIHAIVGVLHSFLCVAAPTTHRCSALAFFTTE